MFNGKNAGGHRWIGVVLANRFQRIGMEFTISFWDLFLDCLIKVPFANFRTTKNKKTPCAKSFIADMDF